MYCMDANNFITGWKTHYPPSVFPSLWKHIAAQQANLIIIKPIYDEIEPLNPDDVQKPLSELAKTRPIKAWLMQQNFQPAKTNASVETLSLQLEQKYGIPPNNQAGANKNDITLIAYAKENNMTVVTFEEKQLQVSIKRKYKIPRICQEEGVRCIKLPQCLEELNITI